MKERRRLEGVDEQELDAITREIHAQLREVYGKGPEPVLPAPHRPEPHPGKGNIARFLAAFLLPPVAMVGLLLVLRLVKDGF